MFRSKKVCCLLLLMLPAASWGYEVSTHAALAREAFTRSTLQTTDLLTRLGISQYQEGLGNFYADMSNTMPNDIVFIRKNSPEEMGRKIGDKDYTKKKFNAANYWLSDPEKDALIIESPAGWMMVGAIREDDVEYDSGAQENPPQDDPQGNFARVLNHFYDPYHDIALSHVTINPLGGVISPTLKIPLGEKAPAWAIEGEDLLGKRTNHFTIKDAKEAMFRAATLRTLDEGQLRPLGLPLNGASMTQEAQRKAYWATVFRALGDAVHNLQDMGQPQHTRNDAHASRPDLET